MATITRSTQETVEFARKFAKNLKGGEVIGLIGELGSGKTVFVKGLAKGLGIKEKITSPTFVMLKEYHAKDILRPKAHPGGVRKKVSFLVHIDAYRVESLDNIESVGSGDYLGRDDAIVVIEWAEKIKEILPKGTIYIKFEHLNKNSRKISLKSRRSEVE